MLMSKAPESKTVSTSPISNYQRSLELKKAAKHLEYILRLGSKDSTQSQGELAEATECLRSLKATDMAGAALLTELPGEAAFVLWNRARRALHSLAPIVMMRLADKLDDANAPGSERVLIDVAKGIGLLVPGQPIDDQERDTAINRKDLADVSTSDLRRRLLGQATGE